MPSQKRPLPSPALLNGIAPPLGDDASPPSPPPMPKQEEVGAEEEVKEAAEVEEEEGESEHKLPPPSQEQGESDVEGGSQSSQSAVDNDEFILVKLADIRKEVQCPICLGIIRKTRTVMECLHRFCRDCIDKSMRLGNNECPACRTHCASRRSLRDDPNYDALIAALYPDIDKYEEEELAFSEEEKNRNKKIQESIAETFRRQSEALGRRRPTAKATAAAFVRKSRGNLRTSGRGRSSGPDIAASSDDDDDEEGNGNNGSKESSSADEHSPDARQKRCRRWSGSRSSPARAAENVDIGFETDDLGVGRENFTTSPLRPGNREMLAWGKNGARSQTRHGNSSGSYGRIVKGSRTTKLVDHLRNIDELENELYVHLLLLPLDGQNMPNLQKPHLWCQPTLSIRQVCQFIAFQLSRQPKEVEIYVRHQSEFSATDSPMAVKSKSDSLEGLQKLEEEKSLSELHIFTSAQGNLELFYALKVQS